MKHVIIFPYYSDNEVTRFLKLVDLMTHLPQCSADYEFLLSASPLTDCSKTLRSACANLAPTISFQCSTSRRGHQEGSLALFWDTMEYVYSHYEHDGGFALWFESDMCPARLDWVDRLDREWRSNSEPITMGNHLTRLPDFLGREKVGEHINGGACYSKKLAKLVSASARFAPFDFAMFADIKTQNLCWRGTDQFVFGTTATIAKQFLDESISIVHGLAQPKDEFLRACIRKLEPHLSNSGSCDGFGTNGKPNFAVTRVETPLHISFSLFGDKPIYSEGAIQNAILAPQIYPASTVRVYFDQTAPASAINRLKRLGCELVDMTGSQLPGMFWRFLINDDPSVDRWLSRDADSRLNQRECSAVHEWVVSGRSLHIMRDHIHHGSMVMGGMFGVCGHKIDIQELLSAWNATGEYGNDQRFLSSCLVPVFQGDVLVHDDLCIAGDHGLPTKCFPKSRSTKDFVGSIYDENNCVNETFVDELYQYEKTVRCPDAD